MRLETIQKLGGICVALGASLLAAYAICFASLLPVEQARQDFSQLVLNPHWRWIACLALFGLILLMAGFAAAYTRMMRQGGITGLLGLLFVELAYLQQAAKVSWEIFLYPLIANHPGSLELLRQGLIRQDPTVGLFRLVGSIAILAGVVLFCFALLRSRVYPRAAGLLIFFGALAYGLGPLFNIWIALGGIATFAFGGILLGRAMVSGRTQALRY